MIAALKDKRVRGVLEDAARQGDARAVSVLSEAKAHAARKRERTRPTREAKAAKREERSVWRSKVRNACLGRSGPRCEACAVWVGLDKLHMDHFWGRAREESAESCWMLCPDCDTAKTENRPDRMTWLWTFGLHAKTHGFAEQVAKCNRAIALESAQHPAAESRSARDAGGRET